MKVLQRLVVTVVLFFTEAKPYGCLCLITAGYRTERAHLEATAEPS